LDGVRGALLFLLDRRELGPRGARDRGIGVVRGEVAERAAEAVAFAVSPVGLDEEAPALGRGVAHRLDRQRLAQRLRGGERLSAAQLGGAQVLQELRARARRTALRLRLLDEALERLREPGRVLRLFVEAPQRAERAGGDGPVA